MATNGKKTSPDGRKRITKMKSKFSWKNLFLYGFLLIFSLFLVSALSGPYETNTSVPISQVVEKVKKGEVTEISVNGDKLTLTEKSGTKLQAIK